MDLCALILAAGKGTRMKSQRPKVLHEILGQPMLAYILDAVKSLNPCQVVVVVGHKASEVEKAFADQSLTFVHQSEQLGTGHAVQIALDSLEADRVLITCGDTPLLSANTLGLLFEEHLRSRASLSFLTAELADPTGYGRIIRDATGGPQTIVEEKDASTLEKKVKEVNAGVYIADRDFLRKALESLRPENAQGEYYLTDIVAWAASNGFPMATVQLRDPDEMLGVNDRRQLAHVENILLQRLRERLMKEGVTLKMPETIYLEPSVAIEDDVTIWPGAVLRGQTVIHRGAEIGPGAILIDALVPEGTRVCPGAIIIGPDSSLC
ncbi:MAG TPA: bifunctional N-acetylglucosamine-1-phosphate uridyltransferase/glucosamine-1-phosphate acetyltransferase [Thermodesulfatator sp.]|nr:bifunctional N-acetylglucosamine-1-phosphate uridyltransferase/glucosamine-1-phosphate acetyltransferase [Thermodesulfatator sp.]